MTYLCYIKKDFRPDTLKVITQAAAIIKSYEGKGLSLTLRQLYYQFVARDLLENTKESYNRLGNIISDARLAGLISWHAIEDRVRNLRGRTFWRDPAAAFAESRSHYLTDRWADQDWRPEVWVEKDALAGVVSNACHDLCIDHFATRGYNSQSEQWAAGQRFASYIQKGQRPIVFHLADHDPAGIDMTRDNQERLSMFAGVQIQAVRLALNMNQVEQYNPPPNYAKPTDSKTAAYIAKFGSDECWELDALSPEIIQDLIVNAVSSLRDPQKWDATVSREAEEKDMMDIVIKENFGHTEQNGE